MTVFVAEVAVYCGILSLGAGLLLGWCGGLWWIGQITTAGAAALLAQLLLTRWGLGGRAGFGGVSLDAMLYLEAVVLLGLGWLFGRWRRDVER